MNAKRSFVFVASLLLIMPTLAQDDITRIDMNDGRVVLELIGQVINLPATPTTPLGSSRQFGYATFVHGIDPVFTTSNPASQNETTAMFTFFTEVTTIRMTTHGPFAIVSREGTTTLYLNTMPASFGNPDSFRSGEAIQTSTMRQQVIVDTVERTFTVVNLNTIDSIAGFFVGNNVFAVGRLGQSFRTSLQGVLFVRSGGTPPPTGHFSGYAVGVPRKRS